MTPQETFMAAAVLGGGLWVLRPIANALARRISGEAAPRPMPGPDESTQAELQQLHADIADLAERLDFAERLLAKQRDAQRIGPGA